MKKLLLVNVLAFFLFSNLFTNAQNVAITDDASYNAHASAMLDVHSESKGILVPRLTTAQRISILTPATGLLVYDTDENQFFYFNGTAWVKFMDSFVTGAAGQTLRHDGTAWVADDNIFNDGNFVGIGTTNPMALLHADGSVRFSNIGGTGSYLSIDANGDLSRTNITESDPIFVSSPAFGITGTDIGNWDSAFSWGNHATAGYAPLTHQHSASDITSGVLGIGRIPVGTTASTVAAGDHTHANFIENETDPTWSGTPNLTSDIGRTGRVGIGNTAPAGKLHISLDGTSDPVIIDRSTFGFGPIMEWYGYSNTHRLQLGYTDSGNQWHYEFNTDESNRHISFAPNNNRIMTLMGTGSVGIGTDDPEAKLEVKGQNTGENQPLFSVKDDDGNEVFVVYTKGVMVYVDEADPSAKSTTNQQLTGFRVGRRTAGGTKGGFDNEFFSVSPSSDIEATVNPSESRVYWNPQREAFMAGRVLVEDVDSVGTNSWASGFEAKSIGDYSQALGYRPRARGDYSTAIGNYAIAEGDNSFALGDSAIAGSSVGATSINNNAYAFGKNAEATGNNSYALGFKAIAEGGASFALGDEALATGDGSFAIGSIGSDTLGNPFIDQTTAVGDYSFAIGMSSRSEGIGSFSVGINNVAQGSGSFAGGVSSQAAGPSSIALGSNARAYGVASYAIGSSAQADGHMSLALGFSARTKATGALSIGTSTNADSTYSIALGRHVDSKSHSAIGIGSEITNNGFRAVALGSHVTSDGSYNIAIGNSITTESESAIAIGLHANATHSSAIALGTSSSATGASGIAIGTFNTASDERAVAIGFQNTANETHAIVLGSFSDATGPDAVAIGRQVTSSGQGSLAAGNFTNASGDASVALGYGSAASGDRSFAHGLYAESNAALSFSMGNSTKANGSQSFAFGSGSETGGGYSLAFGQNAHADGMYSFAFGNNASADDFYSFAFGNNAKASTQTAIAMGSYAEANHMHTLSIGDRTKAMGSSSVALGSFAEAHGHFSMALGRYVKAKSPYTFVIGTYNDTTGSTNNWLGTDPLFIIGNGTANNNRSNALTVLKNGNTGIGTHQPTQKLDIDGQIRIRGGNPGVGKVLTSNADGTATWQTPGAGGGSTYWSASGNNVYNTNTGNIGIGTTSPGGHKLRVVGSGSGSSNTAAYIENTNANGIALRATTNSSDGTALFTQQGGSGYILRCDGYDPNWYVAMVVKGRRMGIGTANPVAGLHVRNADWRNHIVIDRTAHTSINRIFGITQTTGGDGRAQFYFADTDNSSNVNNVFQIEEDGNNSGKVGINTVPDAALHIVKSSGDMGLIIEELNTHASNADGLRLINTPGNYWDIHTSDLFLRFNYNGSNVAYVNNSNGSWVTTSDMRLKENIKPTEKILDKVMHIEVVNYNYISDDRKDKQTGLIAQNAKKLFPEFVSRDIGSEYYGVNYSGFSVVAIKAIQEQQEIIEQQQILIEQQNEKIKQYESRFNAIEQMLEILMSEKEAVESN